MNFLEYGMKNKESACRLCRCVARGMLWIERKKADLYEQILNRKHIDIPASSAQEEERMLREIWEKIGERRQQDDQERRG